jgi:hypothetical protein
MYITPTDTTLTIYPAIAFPNATMTIVIVHKLTKNQVSLTQAYTDSGSGVTMTLPSMSQISTIANNLDELAVRVFDSSNRLYYEMVYRWVTNSPDILLNRKSWTKTNNNQKEWMTI